MALQLHFRLEFGREEARCGQETLGVFKHLHGTFGIVHVACGQRVFRHGDGGEGLAEDITALPQRPAVGSDGEIHVPVLVETVFFDEVDGRFGGLKPFLVLLYMIISVGANEGEAALEPYRLGGVHERSVTVYAGIDTSVFTIEAVLHPERHDILGQVVLVRTCPIADICFYIYHKSCFRIGCNGQRSECFPARLSCVALLRRSYFGTVRGSDLSRSR